MHIISDFFLAHVSACSLTPKVQLAYNVLMKMQTNRNMIALSKPDLIQGFMSTTIIQRINNTNLLSIVFLKEILISVSTLVALTMRSPSEKE